VPPAVPTYIAAGTAYIYNQFVNGNPTYAGYAGTPNATTANEVQATIWYLQGLLIDASGHYGTGGTYDPEGGDLSSLITPIITALELNTGLTLTQLEANGGGADQVVAMNLYDGSNNKQQPQLAIDLNVPFHRLIVVPEPTTMIAGALLLLPFGASTLRILRKRQTA
jgi:hypothetical protein